MGTDPLPEKARSDDFKLRKALWAENDREIQIELDKRVKVRNIEMPSNKLERNYLADLTPMLGYGSDTDVKYWII